MSNGRQQEAPANRPTRREAIIGAGIAFGGLALNAADVRAGLAEEVVRMSESIHQEPVFNASRKQLYEVLTDSAQFTKLTHLSAAVQSGTMEVPDLASYNGPTPTQISREVGGPFSLFSGHIVGRHIDLVPNERIVQAWRVADWKAGVYSIVKFDFTEHASGTKIIFDHTGFPNGEGEHLAAGWKANYWEPLEKFFA
jgi:activator of HSP90 ATPase